MNIKKAIEILDDIYLRGYQLKTADGYAALKLGIEALKECIKARHGNPALDGELLQGETLE